MPFDATDLPYISAGLPGIGGVLREDHADFEVTELPLYEPTGEGTHLYLLVRREGWTTRDLQRRLAELAGCRPDDLGCAGLKDKHARCTQYFSVPRGNESDDGPLIARLQGSEDFELIEANRHANKLKTGHLIGNRFRITVRDVLPEALTKAEAIRASLEETGVPNWFGEQRFGIDASNADRGLAILQGARENRPWQRRFLLSAWQSEMFNRWLKERMELGDLHRLLRGDIAKKTDTGGLFEVEDEIVDSGRLARREVVPTGPLLGGRVRWASGIPGDRERALLVTTKVGEDQLRRNRLNGDRRRALIWPGALVVSRPESDQLVFEFSLPKGSYATTVLREFMKSSSTSSSLDDR